MFCRIYPDDSTVVPRRFVTRNDVGPEAIHRAFVCHAVIHAQFANVLIVHGHYAYIQSEGDLAYKVKCAQLKPKRPNRLPALTDLSEITRNSEIAGKTWDENPKD